MPFFGPVGKLLLMAMQLNRKGYQDDMGNTLPLYLQIQQHLLEKIHNDDWAAQYQISPEEPLARDFGVSRMTASLKIAM